ncbi:DNA polymerase IV [Undibacterium cyanobacteriorum]|uniref:DNA polymerase IV n=2 Tax=Undibacterium cyanobacteriorum TaxID=3073561 RepID=A0ABY9RJN6_9BURK|nr:DNA polymerase IV [Undibacterium sp. 20NA77.5]WMW80485.1 DNA polymerase IV [Undibacterium sp. 20NA77.5]
MLELTQRPQKIIHCDCDCFYASVEMRDDPRLRELPLAIGGQADQRGVIATCNYVARKFGVRSAMPTSQALKLCPDLVVMRPNMEKYRIASRQIAAIYRDYTELVEPLSLDEAYLDVTHAKQHQGSATRIAQEIRARIAAEVGITASAGVAPNKFLAKIASDINKPDGLYVILPEQVSEFVANLPVAKLFGVGKVTAQKLHQLGVNQCSDLLTWSLADLVAHFGKLGSSLYSLCRGVDTRTVEPSSERKSVSVEETYSRDLPDLAACIAEVPELYAALQKQVDRTKAHEHINKLNIKIRFKDFKQTTVECRAQELSEAKFVELLTTGFERRKLPVRLLGLGIGLAAKPRDDQLPLF